MPAFAEKVIPFLTSLKYSGDLPDGITIMNPVRENPDAASISAAFYRKFYNDDNPRHLILGINPGRFGAGTTGIPFTDTVRLKDKCGLSFAGSRTYETSSVFIYEMIDRYGGAEKFYGDFFISAVCPLGFTAGKAGGREVNYNYYDSKKLASAVYPFIIKSLEEQLEFGLLRDVCFCLGTGKNYKFLSELNTDKKYFAKIVPLEHPRFIMQYRLKRKEEYIGRYIEEFSKI